MRGWRDSSSFWSFESWCWIEGFNSWTYLYLLNFGSWTDGWSHGSSPINLHHRGQCSKRWLMISSGGVIVILQSMYWGWSSMNWEACSKLTSDHRRWSRPVASPCAQRFIVSGHRESLGRENTQPPCKLDAPRLKFSSQSWWEYGENPEISIGHTPHMDMEQVLRMGLSSPLWATSRIVMLSACYQNYWGFVYCHDPRSWYL